MRLIDADAYCAEMRSRQEACKEWLAGLADSELQNQAIGTLNAFIEAKLTIDSMPTVDAVPVIRCKDCMFYQKDRGKFMAQKFRSGDGICKMHNYAKVTAAKDYCSWAKREE